MLRRRLQNRRLQNRRLHVGLLIASLFMLAACGSSAPTVDLADTDLLARLKVLGPETVDWKRTVDDVEVAGVDTRPNPDELALLGAALREIPRALREAAEIGTIYRVKEATSDEPTLAYARGPDIYLTDRTFDAVASRQEMLRVLAHELAHVAQFRALEDGDVAAVLDEADPDPIIGSSFVRDFAAAAGWNDNANGNGRPAWRLAATAGTTVYGATGPDEDMAESLAEIVSGRPAAVSMNRLEWVEDWLGANVGELVEGKLYVPEPAQRLESAQPVYDEAEVARRSPGSVNAIYWGLSRDAPRAQQLAADISRQLGTRGFAGALADAEDERIEQYVGAFLRGDGVSYWVELWDFRDANGFRNGPDHPVLTYVELG